jgi:hypothetical protein
LRKDNIAVFRWHSNVEMKVYFSILTYMIV